MLHSITQRLAPLASLLAQRRYIIHSTAEEYCLPTELLNDAYGVIRQVRTMTTIRESLPIEAVRTLLDLERFLDAADLTASNKNLIEHDAAWGAIREHARICLVEMGFDLYAWEIESGLLHSDQRAL